jgi:hypothetical protein
MGMERVAVFEALVDRASALLARDGDDPAAGEATLLLQYLQHSFHDPLSIDEIAELIAGGRGNERAMRDLLDALRLKRLIKTLSQLPSGALTAAE